MWGKWQLCEDLKIGVTPFHPYVWEVKQQVGIDIVLVHDIALHSFGSKVVKSLNSFAIDGLSVTVLTLM